MTHRPSLLALSVLAAACAASGGHGHDEPAFNECAFCGDLVAESEIVIWEHDDKPFKSCETCRDHFEGLVDPRRQAMLDKVKTYRCSGCGAVQTVPAEEPATSCCGHTMRRLY